MTATSRACEAWRCPQPSSRISLECMLSCWVEVRGHQELARDASATEGESHPVPAKAPHASSPSAPSGERNTSMRPLTLRRAKGAVPFAACYRLIDIPISSLIHHGIEKIYVLTQYVPPSPRSPSALSSLTPTNPIRLLGFDGANGATTYLRDRYNSHSLNSHLDLTYPERLFDRGESFVQVFALSPRRLLACQPIEPCPVPVDARVYPLRPLSD
jgi:hypothetical protein